MWNGREKKKKKEREVRGERKMKGVEEKQRKWRCGKMRWKKEREMKD